MAYLVGNEAKMAATTSQPRKVATPPANYEAVAWKWMRYSAILLIPLVWIHVILQDVIVGVHHMDLNYVALRWANMGWRVFDVLLLGFTFAHGVNGLRQILNDFILSLRARQVVSWVLFFFWLGVTVIGAIGIIGGVR
jgi:succinate dehydrogenase / fumarate reductase membrane anchor subunit